MLLAGVASIDGEWNAEEKALFHNWEGLRKQVTWCCAHDSFVGPTTPGHMLQV